MNAQALLPFLPPNVDWLKDSGKYHSVTILFKFDTKPVTQAEAPRGGIVNDTGDGSLVDDAGDGTVVDVLGGSIVADEAGGDTVAEEGAGDTLT